MEKEKEKGEKGKYNLVTYGKVLAMSLGIVALWQHYHIGNRVCYPMRRSRSQSLLMLLDS